MTWILVLIVAAAGVVSCSDSHEDEGGSANGPGPGANGDGTQPEIGPNGFAPRPGTIPLFPGSGTSDAGDPLPNGMVCDAVAAKSVGIDEPIQACYYDKDGNIAATLEQVLECVEGRDAVHIRLTFHPWFVDNTYGETAIGWDARAEAMPMDMAKPMGDMAKPMGMPKPPKMGKSGHTFKDLVGSDHAEIVVTDGGGKTVLQFKLDYLSEDPSQPSGYGSLGVTGGEGKVIVGSASAVVDWSTSMTLNLNDRGYGSYTENSPPTDEDYTPSAEAPAWDYRVVYEAWIDIAVFGSAGFGGATIEFVHASPSKAASNTLEVTKGDCPCKDRGPDEDCGDYPPPDAGMGDPCLDNDPDTWCGDSGTPPPPDDVTPFCKANPQDPACNVD